MVTLGDVELTTLNSAVFFYIYFMSVFFLLNSWTPNHSFSNGVYFWFCFFLLCRTSAGTFHNVTIIFLVKLNQGHIAMWHQTKPWITDTWIMQWKNTSRISRQLKNSIFAVNNIFLKGKYAFLVLFIVFHLILMKSQQSLQSSKQ